MNTPTLSQLADIGAKAAYQELRDDEAMIVAAVHPFYKDEAKAREAFAKAVLDTVGYKFPVDPEREAFDVWYQVAQIPQGETQAFAAWKAGREELRKAQALAKEPDTKTEPAWIEWKGGPCPIPDTVERWEYKLGDGIHRTAYGPPGAYADNWECAEGCGKMYHITAYRVLDWGTTKQPE